MSIFNIEKKSIIFILFLIFYKNNRCSEYEESSDINKKVEMSGDVLETYNLDKGIENSTSRLSKNVNINLNDKYKIQSDKMEEKIINGDKLVYFTGNPKIKGSDATISSNVLIFDIKRKILSLKDNVVCNYKKYNITTELCQFELENNVFTFENYAKIESKDINIESKNGIVNINNNTIELNTNVKIENENYKLTCTRLYTDLDTTRCSGNIIINDKMNTFNIYTPIDVVFTDKNKIIKLRNAIMQHNDFLCFGEEIACKTDSKKIFISKGIEILTKNNYKITCNNLEYDYNDKTGILYNDIMIEINKNQKEENIYITTDLIKFKMIKPVDSVLPLDDLDRFSVYAYKNIEYFENKDNKNRSKVDKNINVVIDNAENTRNINLKGLMLKGSSISFEAEGNVEILSKNIKCRSENFIYENSKIVFTSPIDIWQNDNRIISDNAIMYINDGIEKIVLKDNPYVIFYQDGFPNQVKCEEIYIGLRNSSIDKILFNKDVDSILFITNNNELKYINNLKTNKLCIIFDFSGKPINALFNQNSGKIITIKDVDKNNNILFMDRYNDTLLKKAPSYNKISRKLKKTSNIPTTYKIRFFRNE